VVHKWLAVKLPTTRRKMWSAVKRQMTELKNRQKTLDQFQDTNNAQKAKMAEPKLNFIIDAAKKQIRVKSKNVKTVTANFYSINIEQLFSISPFTAGRDALSYVQPTATMQFETVKKEEEVKERDSDSTTDSEAEEQRRRKMSAARKRDPNADVVNTRDFPKGFSEKSNFVVELLGDGTTGPRVAKTQFNNNLYVEFNKARGDLFVGNFSKFPEVKAYVKVYLATAKNPDGFFLKDGYTDLRGRFDYLSSNTDAHQDGTKVAVLVVSEACGANVYYADIQK